jgi:16S rRNA (guanine1207-N2)-methyltransferase
MLAVNGAKTDGIDGIARQIGAAIPLADVFVKAHGRVVVLRRPERLPDAVAAWAAAAAASRTAAGFVTAPGLFSAEGPDPGSAALVDRIDAGMSGRVADLGAGWGYLAHAALARAPGITHLDLVEAEALALDAARENVRDPRAAFHWADATRPDPDAEPYDAVMMNPPFHAGRAADPELGAAFVHAAARRLKPKGRLYLVANRQLPYEAPLDEAFVRHQRLFEDGRYKVILAERPRRRH